MDRQSTLAPFRHVVFRNLWISSAISNLGAQVQVVGAGWAMTNLTDSPVMVALVQGAAALPVMLFSFVAGALADNFDRRILMLVAQLGMVVVSLILVAITGTGWLTAWALLATTFIIGCGTALHNPSWQASIGDLVARSEVASAVSVNSMGINVTRSLGPALGGLAVALGGSMAAFIFNTVSYLPLIAILRRWRSDKAQRELPPEKLGRALITGLQYAAMSPSLVIVLLRAFLFSTAAVSILALLPLVAKELLGSGALSYGTLLGCFGLGAVAGALLNVHIREKVSHEAIVRISCGTFAVACILLGWSRSVLISHTVLVFAGISWVLAFTLFNATIQLSIPRWVVGRMLSFYHTAVFGGMALGSVLWGAIADVAGLQVAMLCAGLACLGVAAFGVSFALSQFALLNLDPLESIHHPDLGLEVAPHTGPVVITVEYIIGAEDIPKFIELIAERRRIRLRDGVRRWVLLHDLERLDVWSERYHVASWVDYRRIEQRRTQADADNFYQLLLLHRGAEGPKISHQLEKSIALLRAHPSNVTA